MLIESKLIVHFTQKGILYKSLLGTLLFLHFYPNFLPTIFLPNRQLRPAYFFPLPNAEKIPSFPFISLCLLCIECKGINCQVSYEKMSIVKHRKNSSGTRL